MKQSLKQRRWTRRIVRHHVPLLLLSVLGLVVVEMSLDSPDPLFRWSMATAYVAAGLLCVTLLTGPFNVLRGRPNPVSTDLRRDVGIWAGLLGLAHMVVGLQVHFRGRMWFYFVREVEETGALVFRSDLFGFANYTGLLSALGLVLLLVLSNDRSLRRLRSGRWKGLQRWNYAVFALAAFHAVAYQVIEKRAVEYAILLGILLIPTVFLQLLGFRTRWRERARE